jgi:urease accessory protein
MRITRFHRFAALAAVFVTLPLIAHAHPGHDGHELTWDLGSGFAHPFSGWDHLLAMLAVGLWAAQLGGRARWSIPAAFLGTMVLGATLGHAGSVYPGIEQGIAASVLGLGLLIAASVRLPMIAGMVLVGIFAIFHGIAHGAEMPATAGGFSYGFGFIAAIALLHLAGVGLGFLSGRRSEQAMKFAGWAIAASGVALFAA